MRDLKVDTVDSLYFQLRPSAIILTSQQQQQQQQQHAKSWFACMSQNDINIYV